MDLSVRVYKPAPPDEALRFELHTFEPDADDEGRARDYGRSIVEGGEIVGDGSKDGYDIEKIRVLLSLLEHAPDLLSLLQALDREGVLGYARPLLKGLAARLLEEISRGDMRYRPEM
jgi:hypothetical protein